MLVAEDLGLLVLGQLAQEGVGLAQQQVDQESEHFLKFEFDQDKLCTLLMVPKGFPTTGTEVYGYSDSV